MDDWERCARNLAEYFAGSEAHRCLLCTNRLKNIHFHKSEKEIFGCDGNCDDTSKLDFSVEHLIDLAMKERR